MQKQNYQNLNEIEVPNYTYIEGGRIIAMFDDNSNMMIHTIS